MLGGNESVTNDRFYRGHNIFRKYKDMRGSKQKTQVPMSKKREDRTSTVRHTFEPLVVETKNIQTVLLMLKSPEEYIVAQALYALDKFVTKSPDNARVLMLFDILTEIQPLLRHNEISVRRVATKLISQLSPQEDIKKSITTDLTQIPYFVEMLHKEIDIPLQEFSSAILAEIAENQMALPQIFDTNILDILFVRMKSHDPDVQYNSARILMSMLIEPDYISEVVRSRPFDFAPILALVQSDYPVIQNKALEILKAVTRLRENEKMQKAFRDCNGINQLMDILEMFDWLDLHGSVLEIIGNVVEREREATFSAPYVNTSSNARRLIQYAEDITDPELIEADLAVIAKMASCEMGRRVLVDNNVIDVLLRYLRDDNSQVRKAACLGIGAIIQTNKALEMLRKENPLRDVINIVKSESESPETRHGAAVALCNILESDRYFCDLFVNLKHQDTILGILKHSSGKSTCSVEMLITLLQCLAVLAINETTRLRMVDSDVSNAILPHFESLSPQLRIAACITLGAYACETKIRVNFAQGNGVGRLINCLKHDLMPVRQAAACLLQLLACDSKIAPLFISTGILFWMLEQKQTLNVCPAWETAIETLFKSCLPAKFAHKNRLELQDVTENIFYVTRKPGKKFVVVDEMFSICAVPIHVVYVSNCADKETTENLVNKGRKSKCRKKPEEVLSPDEGSEIEHISRYVYDSYLYDYLCQIKAILRDEEERVTRLSTNRKVAVLGHFVASKMCGITKGTVCTNHLCNLHITELKRQLGTTIIPLGYIRVGTHFERALLFKVLADQIELPCALVRGEYGRTWVEISTPQLDPPDEEFTIHVDDLPKRLLKTNCVVDLMEDPGKLLPIGSYAAAAYCAHPSAEE